MSGAGKKVLKVFVSNLPWTISSKELKSFASSFGPVLSSNVVFDKSKGMSKGFGFVVFGTEEAFNTATRNNVGSYMLEGNAIQFHRAEM